MGFSERGLTNLVANGMDTLGTLAFGIGQPGVLLADDASTTSRGISWGLWRQLQTLLS